MNDSTSEPALFERVVFVELPHKASPVPAALFSEIKKNVPMAPLFA